MTAAADAERQAELRALGDAVRDLVAGSGGIGAARRRLDADHDADHDLDHDLGYDEKAWALFARDMGLAGLGIPESVGGAGGGLAELCVVAEELGRSLLPVPFLSSTVLAGQLLARCADRAGDVLARLSSGAELVAFVGADASGCWNADRLGVTADAAGLHGSADFVMDGVGADHLVVAARTDAGCDLFLVDARDPQVARRGLTTLDPTRPQASVTFTDASGVALTSGGAGAAIVDEVLDVVLTVLAAEQVGGTAACLDMAVGYAKIRHQFSRPIGGFQAIKHKLADVLLLVEMGRSAVDRAVQVADDRSALAEAAAVAQIWCSDAYTAAADENVHIHGGMGFTWEHDAHLHFRRARADQLLFGDSAVHRERLATLLAW